MNEQEWFKQVDKLKRQFDKINAEWQKAVASGRSHKMLSARSRVEKEMPKMLESLESLTPPKGGELEKSWKYFIDSLKGYLLACRTYWNGFLDDDESVMKDAIGHFEKAGKLLEKARKIIEE